MPQYVVRTHWFSRGVLDRATLAGRMTDELLIETTYFEGTDYDLIEVLSTHCLEELKKPLNLVGIAGVPTKIRTEHL
jgi:hypothetical protein